MRTFSLGPTPIFFWPIWGAKWWPPWGPFLKLWCNMVVCTTFISKIHPTQSTIYARDDTSLWPKMRKTGQKWSISHLAVIFSHFLLQDPQWLGILLLHKYWFIYDTSNISVSSPRNWLSENFPPLKVQTQPCSFPSFPHRNLQNLYQTHNLNLQCKLNIHYPHHDIAQNVPSLYYQLEQPPLLPIFSPTASSLPPVTQHYVIKLHQLLCSMN